ncbi:MAG: hypothetical protein ACYC5N_05965, partial [Endomicrobiales bacterium]
MTQCLYPVFGGDDAAPAQGEKRGSIQYREAAAPEERAGATATPVSGRPLPVYLSELSNINDYALFANSGWDGNWYAGFNVCWMEALPAAPQGEYVKAFVGAKIGRMKTRSAQGRPVWEKEPIPGSIYMALSSTPAWKNTQSNFLVDTRDLPLEGDFENALEGVGEARWFWAEVPLSSVNFDGPNYVALWSPTEYFVSTASSPILAGGWGSQKVNSWMNNDVRGYPPINPRSSLKTPITVFEPAIAMKLVPAGAEQEIVVTIDNIREGRDGTANKSFFVSVRGEEIEKAWLEISVEGGPWEKRGRYAYSAPFFLTLKADALPEGKINVRCA